MAQDKLKQFILKHKTEKGKPFTNTSIGNPKISLFVPNDEYEDFLNINYFYFVSNFNLIFPHNHTITTYIVQPQFTLLFKV